MQQAIDLLRSDIVKYEDAVNKAMKVPLTQYEFDALVSFHYNTGAIVRATLTKTLNAGDKLNSGKQFMSWVKPPEIKGRRQAESTLFLTGKYPPSLATVYPADANGKVLWNKGARVNVRELLGGAWIATPAMPAPAPLPTPSSAIIQPQRVPDGNWLAALLKAVAAIFGARK